MTPVNSERLSRLERLAEVAAEYAAIVGHNPILAPETVLGRPFGRLVAALADLDGEPEVGRCPSCGGTGEREVMRRSPVSRGCIPQRVRCPNCAPKQATVCLRSLDDHAITEEEFERLEARINQALQ